MLTTFNDATSLVRPNPPGRPIIDAWPEIPPEAAAERLARVGLADAFSWCRCPVELSTGQRARFDLAWQLHQGPNYIVIDEFLNHLDRLTARSVAWSAVRELRRLGIGAVLITSIDDVAESVQPDLHIRVGWKPEPTLIWEHSIKNECPLISEFNYERGNIGDWKQLKHLHYAAGDPSTIHSIHVLRHKEIEHPAAVAILSYPDLHSAARNIATHDEYAIRGQRMNAQRLNKEVLKITRIVVAPEVRACGLTKILIPELIASTNARYYECVTAMGRYSRFLAALGFFEVPAATEGIEAEVLDWAARENVPVDVLLHSDKLPEWIDRQTVRKKRFARKIIWNYYHQFVLHRRTRRAKPKVIPSQNDEGWDEAYALVARRCHERPSYWLLGPVDR